MYVGSAGKGTLHVGGTGRLAIVGDLQNSAHGTGTIIVAGGTLSAGSFENYAVYQQSGGVATVGPVASNGQLFVSGGTLNTVSIAQATLSTSGTGTVVVAPNGTASSVSILGNLSIAGSSRVDMNDNDAIVQAGSYNTLAGYIRTAQNGNAWDGPGLTSTSAKTNGQHNTTLGLLTGRSITRRQAAPRRSTGRACSIPICS